MAKLKFRNAKLNAASLARLGQINRIILEYQKLNMRLTLRQLYYQLVSRDIIPNKLAEYSKLSNLLKEGRMAGMVDWAAIEDRLRTAEKPSAWNSPADIMETVINAYEKPRMNDQPVYMEVWVEKDALSGVLSPVTSKYHVPILVNRGYSSVSAIFDSYNRFRRALQRGQKVVILYLGDFDPSGVDMIRDVYDRPLEMLISQAEEDMQDVTDELTEEQRDDLMDSWGHDERTDSPDEYDNTHRYFSYPVALVLERFKVVSIALTRAQIKQYNPPPNPAKVTDPRAADFIKKHGAQSWEVDALRPEVLNALLTNEIETRLDLDKYEAILVEEEKDVVRLKALQSILRDQDRAEDGQEDEE